MHPILFHIGPLTIRMYGLFVAIGMLIGLQYVVVMGRKKNIPDTLIMDMGFWSVVAGLVGARLMYVLLNWRYYAANLFDIVKIWEGGLVYYGGVIAGILAAVFFLRRHREIGLWAVFDLVAPGLALGHFFGRIGCFFAGCCYGAPCELPWSVTFSDPASLAPLNAQLHPTQLYEAIGTAAIFVILHLFSRRSPRAGYVTAAYLALYGIVRFSLEYFRGDDRGAFLAGFSPGQVISLILILSAAVIFTIKKHEHTQ